MDIKSCQVFAHLAEHLHFSQTASTFHMSPSTLSRWVQRLEVELDSQLLYRDNRTVALTPSGEVFHQYCKAQILEWQNLQARIQQQQGTLSGTLSLYCSVTAAYSHLPAMLDKFREKYPQVEITLETGNAADAFQKVHQKDVDLAIAAHDDSLPASCFFHPIASIPVAIIAPTIPCHVTSLLEQFAQQQHIDWQSLPVILPDHGPIRRRFDRWYQQQTGDEVKQKPNIYARVSGHEALVSMVALGCGIGIAPQVVIDNSPVQDRIRPLVTDHPIPDFTLGVCGLSNRATQPLLEAFIDCLEKQ
ncbi:HTH-type transcriptional activator IlvY [Thalassotalea mangrovi]|uniref:HTH-type transcriptional activator IlvY n=1 Tax=Thalassotalea mangrovi TaxID=2572245 RepID=A0A4V5NU91_9GAMM|nr:HTH-type transcriptional activator IlvY [Thalassotalea mangrovi]TKB45395.1 HTH-type transcriptional activator IlvY [Thalassotalea mangrovi]